MNEILLEILPDIDKVIQGVTLIKEEQDEVRQELILKIYDNEATVKQLYKSQKIKGWLFMVAKRIFIDGKRKVRDSTISKASIYIDELNHRKEYLPNIKTIEKMFEQLTEIEKMWIETYVECGYNYAEVHRRTAIGRQHVKERIQEIFEKWKQLDIYLPS